MRPTPSPVSPLAQHVSIPSDAFLTAVRCPLPPRSPPFFFGNSPNSGKWAAPGTGANYTYWMKYIYTMQNLTFGSDGGLTAACQAKHPTEPHLCFMSPHMQVRKPFNFWPRRSTAVSGGCLEGFLCERLQLEMGRVLFPPARA